MLLGLPVRRVRDDDRGGRRPPPRYRGRARGHPQRHRGPRQDGLPGRGARGQEGPPGEGGGLPHLPRRPGARALRPLRPHPRPRRTPLRRPLPRRAARVVRRVLGAAATSRSTGSTSAPSSRSASTSSPWRRPAPGPTSRASPPRASPAPATRATTSGTPRSMSSRSSPSPSPTSPGTCCTSATGCCRRPAAAPARWRRAARCSRGARSTARRRRRTTRPVAPRCTSTPTSPTPCCSTSAPATTSASWSVTGVDLLVETARMWAELGFWRSNGERSFHIHGVTGPDEYTTVVNNNLFTNVMARYNLDRAALVVDRIKEHYPGDHAAAGPPARPEGVGGRRVAALRRGHDHPVRRGPRHPPAGRLLPRPRGVGPLAHAAGEPPADAATTTRWSSTASRCSSRPTWCWRCSCTATGSPTEQKKANFEYYDPITTGDSTLSAVVQSIVAAEVGYHEAAMDYFKQALYVDLADLHENTVDGLHVASSGGVWSALDVRVRRDARPQRPVVLRPATARGLEPAALPRRLAGVAAARRADPGRACDEHHRGRRARCPGPCPR